MHLALIPAGGRSQRMGRPKLALPLGGRSVLERVVGALREGQVEHVVVVVGPHVPELIPLAQAAGAHAVVLPRETPDMRATVEHGLRWLGEQFHPGDRDHWFLAPGDHPTLEAGVVRRLLQATAEQPQYSIVVPAYQGCRGHPTSIGWKHVPGIHALPVGQGLNVYLRRHTAETLEMPVQSAEILCDLDTPEDYERLRRRWE